VGSGLGWGGCTAAARVHQFRGVARCSRQARTSIPRPPSKPKLELEPKPGLGPDLAPEPEPAPGPGLTLESGASGVWLLLAF
jgi:hypothetical protein